ncbi:MAG: RNA ligase family protein [Pseudoxanthomonas sp.]|nr:RNA ligase family protein [Pseudoxanthomonas sp.]
MSDFFRFPTTPHLAWLGGGDTPRDDKVLSPEEAGALLSGEVVVEEKLDGANLGFSLDGDGNLRAQNRGQYLAQPHAGQFARLPAWESIHGDALRSVLSPELILFGEWCAARHSLDYTLLPDWFLVFDVYDRSAGHFWSTARRDRLAADAGLQTVPQVLLGHTGIAELEKILVEWPSRYRSGPMEGVVVRRQDQQHALARAKLVRADFTQAIEGHWRSRAIEWNRVVYAGRETG